MSAPPDDTLCRLGSIAGMLGSSFAGERSNAAEAATALLRRHGWTWRELVDAAFRKSIIIDLPEGPPWREQLQECAANAHLFTGWERSFLANLRQWRGQPTAKQVAALARLHAKVVS